MKKIDVYEFKDLEREAALKVWEEQVEGRVKIDIECLTQDVNDNQITEEQYYNELGCSKFYAESTAWFVPSCYYEKHRTIIHQAVKEELQDMLFTKDGQFIECL